MIEQHLRHVIGIDDLSRDQILSLFRAADAIRAIPARARRHLGRIVGTLFFEPSTRTRLSFESASLQIGAQYINITDAATSSAAKGEALIDTIRTVERYCDLIVLRHPAEGAALLASKVSRVPVVNAGDGGHEHPTQTLFDLYTIHQRRGDIAGCKIGLLGDLRYGRTVHSLARAAARFGSELIFIAPEPLQMPEHVLDRLQGASNIRSVNRLDEVIAELNVLYATRLQLERLNDDVRHSIDELTTLHPADLARARSDLLILHPLPRVGEIAFDVDEDPRAQYFEQLANGVLMRMALLDQILAQAPIQGVGACNDLPPPIDTPWKVDERLGNRSCANSRCVTNVERDVMPRSIDGAHCDYCSARLA